MLKYSLTQDTTNLVTFLYLVNSVPSFNMKITIRKGSLLQKNRTFSVLGVGGKKWWFQINPGPILVFYKYDSDDKTEKNFEIGQKLACKPHFYCR